MINQEYLWGIVKSTVYTNWYDQDCRPEVIQQDDGFVTVKWHLFAKERTYSQFKYFAPSSCARYIYQEIREMRRQYDHVRAMHDAMPKRVRMEDQP